MWLKNANNFVFLDGQLIKSAGVSDWFAKNLGITLPAFVISFLLSTGQADAFAKSIKSKNTQQRQELIQKVTQDASKSKPVATQPSVSKIVPKVNENKPQSLTTVPGVGKDIQLDRDAAAAYNQMLSAARAAGIKSPLLLPASGYRSSERQEQLWQAALKRYKTESVARKWVAPPGKSAHQSGRAIDFNLGGRNSSGNVKQLRTLPAYKWLVANASKYGFSPYVAEPWHWEYRK